MTLFNTIVSKDVKTIVLVNTNKFINNVEMELKDRISKARVSAQLSVEELAFKVGCSSDLIRKLEAGARKGTTFIVSIANVCGVNPTWLSAGDGEMVEPPPMFARSAKKEIAEYSDKNFPIDLENNIDYPSIKRVNLKLSAGISGFAIDYDVENKAPIVMRKEWFGSRGYRPEKLLAVVVHGDSMQSGLYHGDTVVINTADTQPSDGDVFAINYEGEMLIKRMVRDAGVWWLSSDNPDQRKYPRKECASDMCLIIGKIVHKQSERI
jgi:phage repressor protein C with HTH and peptisase S24 domain